MSEDFEPPSDEKMMLATRGLWAGAEDVIRRLAESPRPDEFFVSRFLESKRIREHLQLRRDTKALVGRMDALVDGHELF